MALVNENVIAEESGLSVKTLRQWRFAGSGPPYYKLGRAVRYDPEEFKAWYATRKRLSTSEPIPPTNPKPPDRLSTVGMGS